MKLPEVSLICIDDVDPKGAAKVLNHCSRMIEFGAVKLLTSKEVEYPNKVTITPLNTLVMYSIFCLTRLHEYIDTPNVLIVQRDGWILNPEKFRREWLKFDYIAPLFMQIDKVGSGGFSMRSKILMSHASRIFPTWDGSNEDAENIQKVLGYYEDGILSLSHHVRGFNIANIEQGCEFGQGGNRNPNYFRDKPFGFHRTWQQIDFNTGTVDSTDLSRDITPNYDDIVYDLH